MMNKDYTPIGCALYSEYELLIMHREPLRLSYLGAGNRSRIETLMPVNLRTHRKAEYLIARNPAGICRVLRLDRIRAFDRMRADTAQ
jgi:Rho-binding antiterminator